MRTSEVSGEPNSSRSAARIAIFIALMLTQRLYAAIGDETREAKSGPRVDFVVTREKLHTGVIEAELVAFRNSASLNLKSGDAYLTCPDLSPPHRKVVAREEIYSGCWVELGPDSTGEISVDESLSAFHVPKGSKSLWLKFELMSDKD